MARKLPKIMWHHGTCTHCKRRLTLVLHFGYDEQFKHSYQICLRCFSENSEEILFGWTKYKVDNTIDNLSCKTDKDGYPIKVKK